MAQAGITQPLVTDEPVLVYESGNEGYVDWPAILAGAVLATAIAFVLTTFGIAIGLSVVSPFGGEGVGGAGIVIGMGLWALWVAGSSFMAGAYLTGRLRRRVPDATEHEVDVRDGAHGLVMWGVGIIFGAILLATGAYSTANVGAQVASGAVQAAGEAAGAADISLDGYLAGALLRGDGSQAQAGPRIEPVDGGGAAPAGAPAQSMLAGNSDEVAGILRTATSEEGLADADRGYLVALVQQRTGLSEEEASARIDDAVTRLQTAAEDARQVADTARKISVVAAFIVAASLLVAAAGAWWGAGLGGRHRDEGTVFAHFGRRK
ncbi:MAG: hypothetical protein H6842_00280 [Rhodospirillaceae bacterium]|nr:hypothetical protein [Rhodospirillaceae bacterium]